MTGRLILGSGRHLVKRRAMMMRFFEFLLAGAIAVVGLSGGNLNVSGDNGQHWVGLHRAVLWPDWVCFSIAVAGALLVVDAAGALRKIRTS